MGTEILIAIIIASVSLVGTVITAAMAFKSKSNTNLFGASESMRRDVVEANERLINRMDAMEEVVRDFRDKFNNINEMLSYVAIRIDLLIKRVNKSISAHDEGDDLQIENLFDMKKILEQIEEKIEDFKKEESSG